MCVQKWTSLSKQSFIHTCILLEVYLNFLMIFLPSFYHVICIVIQYTSAVIHLTKELLSQEDGTAIPGLSNMDFFNMATPFLKSLYFSELCASVFS